MLLANKREVEEISALLEQGADSPTELAKVVIKRMTELREERKFFALVFGMRGGAHLGFGPFATIDAAFNSVDKNPVAYTATKAAVVPIYGPSQTQAMWALADEPPISRGDFAIVREDAIAFKNGWDGKERTKRSFLPPST